MMKTQKLRQQMALTIQTLTFMLSKKKYQVDITMHVGKAISAKEMDLKLDHERIHIAVLQAVEKLMVGVYQEFQPIPYQGRLEDY
ncbi:MAG: hypothetical protein JEZ06_04430 [Anaerolineaceae bacterium]|nr:hypothetical protein [Anaerolineaceae bacterium]